MAVISNMHMDTRVNMVVDFKSEVTFEAIEAVRRLPWPQRPPKKLLEAICINTMVIEVAAFPEPFWRTPSLILACMIALLLLLRLHDLIKKRFFRVQNKTSLEMSTTTDAKQPGKWKRVLY